MDTPKILLSPAWFEQELRSPEWFSSSSSTSSSSSSTTSGSESTLSDSKSASSSSKPASPSKTTDSTISSVDSPSTPSCSGPKSPTRCQTAPPSASSTPTCECEIPPGGEAWVCSSCWPHPYWTPSEERNRRKKRSDPTKKEGRKRPDLRFLEYLDSVDYARQLVPY